MNRTAVALLLFLWASARADRTPFQVAYEAGQDAFNLGRYPEALEAFTRARDLDPRLPGPHRWRGRILRILERWDECIASSTQAVRLKPTSPLVPEVRKDLEACRAALGRPSYERRLPEGQGALAVIADVEGAAVFVDQIAKGATPLAPMPLNGGRHVVRLTAPSRAPVDLDVEVVPGIVIDAVMRTTAK
jgi:tetratricopeptide (TPR) repeat protein